MKKLLLLLLPLIGLSCLTIPEISKSKPLFKIEYLSEGFVKQAIFIPGSSNKLAVATTGPIFCYDWLNNEAIFETASSFLDPTYLSASPDGLYIAVGRSGSVALLDAATGTLIKDHGMAFGSKTYWIGFTNEDSMRLIGTYRGVAAISKPKGLIRDLTVTLDVMNYIYSGVSKEQTVYFGQRGRIQVYNLAEEKLEDSYTVPGNTPVTGLFINPKDNTMLAVSENSIFTVDKDTKRSTLLFSIPTGTGSLVKLFPAFSDAELYGVTQRGLYVFNLDGTVKQSVSTKDTIVAADISSDFRYLCLTTVKGFYIYNLRDFMAQ